MIDALCGNIFVFVRCFALVCIQSGCSSFIVKNRKKEEIENVEKQKEKGLPQPRGPQNFSAPAACLPARSPPGHLRASAQRAPSPAHLALPRPSRA
jgi:hypothetical protein